MRSDRFLESVVLLVTNSVCDSPLMAPKQVEMDKVVERIYRHLEYRDEADGQRSLLVLLGDHGMTEVSPTARPPPLQHLRA